MVVNLCQQDVFVKVFLLVNVVKMVEKLYKQQNHQAQIQKQAMVNYFCMTMHGAKPFNVIIVFCCVIPKQLSIKIKTQNRTLCNRGSRMEMRFIFGFV